MLSLMHTSKGNHEMMTLLKLKWFKFYHLVTTSRDRFAVSVF